MAKAKEAMSSDTWEIRTETTGNAGRPMGLTEWAEETRRMLVEIYPTDIFVRDANSTEPGCRMLFVIEQAWQKYYDIKSEARS